MAATIAGIGIGMVWKGIDPISVLDEHWHIVGTEYHHILQWMFDISVLTKYAGHQTRLSTMTFKQHELSETDGSDSPKQAILFCTLIGGRTYYNHSKPVIFFYQRSLTFLLKSVCCYALADCLYTAVCIDEQ